MSVTIINPFEVPEDGHEEAIELWDRAASLLAKQAGYIDGRLHKAVDSTTRFQLVTVAEWESVTHFLEALNSEEMQELDRTMSEFPHSPGLYEGSGTGRPRAPDSVR